MMKKKKKDAADGKSSFIIHYLDFHTQTHTHERICECVNLKTCSYVIFDAFVDFFSRRHRIFGAGYRAFVELPYHTHAKCEKVTERERKANYLKLVGLFMQINSISQ